MYLGILVSDKNADLSVWFRFCFKETLQLFKAGVVWGPSQRCRYCRLSTCVNHRVADADSLKSTIFAPLPFRK